MSRPHRSKRQIVPGWNRVGTFAPIVEKDGRVWLVLPGLPPVMGPPVEAYRKAERDFASQTARADQEESRILEFTFPA